MLILHTSVDGDRATYREHATWAWFDRHEHELPQDWTFGHIILERGEAHKFDYDGIIKHFWGMDDLFIWERDMVPYSVEQVLEVANCLEESCSIDYALWRCYVLDVETKDGSPLLLGDKGSHFLVCAEHQVKMSMMRSPASGENPFTAKKVIWNDGTWTHCDVPPLGLTRLRKGLMERVRPQWPPTHWLDVDQMVGNTLALAGVKTHIHYPMARHMRKFKPQECVFVATIERKWPVVPLHFVRPEYRDKIVETHKAMWTHTDFPKVVVP